MCYSGRPRPRRLFQQSRQRLPIRRPPFHRAEHGDPISGVAADLLCGRRYLLRRSRRVDVPASAAGQLRAELRAGRRQPRRLSPRQRAAPRRLRPPRVSDRPPAHQEGDAHVVGGGDGGRASAEQPSRQLREQPLRYPRRTRCLRSVLSELRRHSAATAGGRCQPAGGHAVQVHVPRRCRLDGALRGRTQRSSASRRPGSVGGSQCRLPGRRLGERFLRHRSRRTRPTPHDAGDDTVQGAGLLRLSVGLPHPPEHLPPIRRIRHSHRGRCHGRTAHSDAGGARGTRLVAPRPRWLRRALVLRGTRPDECDASLHPLQ